jgi:hypothetical protein
MRRLQTPGVTLALRLRPATPISISIDPSARKDHRLCHGGSLHEAAPGADGLEYRHEVHARIEEALRFDDPVRTEHGAEPHLRGFEVALAEMEGRRAAGGH